MTQQYTEDPLLALVRATAEEQFAALRGREVLVAVSGGADSLALLDVLLALRSELKIELAVVHFDHRLRPESGEQARVLADYVGTLHLPYELGGGDVRALAREHGLSVEAAARRARYSILGEAATRRGSLSSWGTTATIRPKRSC
ncbi:MAG: ATP-binding protein [Chloroflexia bacterium]